MGDRSLSALVYGDVNLNLIDGSAVWLVSTAECLARCDVEVTVLLKASITTERLTRPLRELPGVTLIEPTEKELNPQAAAGMVVQQHQETPFDLIIARGSRVVSSMVEFRALREVLWTYLTDIPQSVTELDAGRRAELATIVRGSRKILCQTPELRCFVEAVVPGATGRTLLWEPMIPDVPEPFASAVLPDGPVRVGYAGKFAPLWNTDLMLALPAQTATHGASIELHMVGDKIHRADLDFAHRMEQGLVDGASATWHGGKDRQDTLALMASWDIGLSWRDPALNSSLELSTKVLEYGSVGTAPLMNRTPMHERLFGRDYPLFVDSRTSVVELLVAASRDRGLISTSAGRARKVAEYFTMQAAVQRTRRILARAFPTTSTTRNQPLRVAIAGHDLKFMHGIADLLNARHDMEVRTDVWSGLSAHEEHASREILDWAEVIVCEWAGPNAVWYSTRKKAHQRLIIRLHRFELEAPWIRDVATGAVESIVCVNDHYRQRVIDETPFGHRLVVTIPNAIDRDYFDRPKVSGAERRIGMLGIVPFRKRPDRAVSLLRRLNGESPGFLLSLKSAMPWDHAWIWGRPHERTAYRRLFDDISLDPGIRDHVVIEGHGGDVASWLQRTGWVLSMSEDESFHLAPAEGMAAGSVPVVLAWPGAHGVYDPAYICDNEDEMVEHILGHSDRGAWERLSRQVREDFRLEYDLPVVAERWAELLLGER